MKILIVLRAWDGLNEVAPICKMILQETLICNLIPKPEAISKAATSWNHARWSAVEPCLAASVRRKPNDGREIRDARLTAILGTLLTNREPTIMPVDVPTILVR
jgi:hypothetical protein